jgi:hypothetical protein
MEKNIIVVMIIIGLLLLGAIGTMTYILVTREAPIVEIIEEASQDEIIIEPPPLEEEALKEATLLIGERLRVFDVEERQDKILAAIKAELSPEMNLAVKKQIVRDVVDTELTLWKEQVIRDTLIELYGEYSSEDYEAIDGKTNIGQLIAFITGFELEVLGIK